MTEVNEDLNICEFCLSDNELRDEVQQRGRPIEECRLCHSKGGRSLPANDRTVRRISRALIRLHFSEWDYNTHLSGDSIQSLVFGSKCIFNLPTTTDEIDFEEVFLELEEKSWYPENEEDISLGGGYWEGGILDGLRDRLDSDVDVILSEAFKKNYFELAGAVDTLLKSIQPDIIRDLSPQRFFRARIGVKARYKQYIDLGPALRQCKHYLPFSGKEIDRPPIPLATEGRFNRAGVSIHYLATDADTAVAELRPHPGHLISVAEFSLTRPIKVADFSAHDIRHFLSDSRLEHLRRILSVGAVLHLPVQPEHRSLYILTHLFADRIQEAGFEGIVFKSSVGAGKNLTCFVPDAMSFSPNSERVIEVVKLEYQLASAPTLSQNFDTNSFEKDGDDLLSTLFDGIARHTSVKYPGV